MKGLGLILVVTAVIYGIWIPSMTIVYEDISVSPHVDFARPSMQPRWLLSASWTLDQKIGGPTYRVRVAHVVNLILHLIVVVVVWKLTQTLKFKAWSMCCATAIMAWHPLQTEAAAYLGGRPDLLVTLFVLLAVLVSLTVDAWSVRAIGVCLCLYFAYASKETGVIGLGLVWWTVACRRTYELKAWTWLVVPLCLIGSILTVPMLLRNPQVQWAWLSERSVFEHAGMQAAAIVRLGLLTILPLGQTVDHDYTRVWISVGIAALALFGALAVVAWRQRRTIAGFGLGWTLLAVSYRLVLPTGEAVNEHQWYLSMVGCAILIGPVVADAAVNLTAGFLRWSMGDPW